jgi:ion channel-forming bestrophin family protein
MIQRHDWYRSFVVRGSVVPRIYLRVIVFTLVSVVETFANLRGWIPFDLPWSATAVMGSAVGLHIAFRTNSGYERFWEARTAWGAIVNRTRNLARQVHALFEGEERRDAILLTIAFAHGSKRHFWDDDAVLEVDALLGRERSLALQAEPGMPQRTLLDLGVLFTRARRRGRIDSIEQQRLEEDLTSLLDQFGICQRIRSTPLPDAYVIQLRTALTLFLLAIPLAVGGRIGWFTPALVFVVAYVFVGMEQIGTELEDPFERTLNDVKLDEITFTIERDLLALCDDAPAEADDGDATAINARPRPPGRRPLLGR